MARMIAIGPLGGSRQPARLAQCREDERGRLASGPRVRQPPGTVCGPIERSRRARNAAGDERRVKRAQTSKASERGKQVAAPNRRPLGSLLPSASGSWAKGSQRAVFSGSAGAPPTCATHHARARWTQFEATRRPGRRPNCSSLSDEADESNWTCASERERVCVMRRRSLVCSFAARLLPVFGGAARLAR